MVKTTMPNQANGGQTTDQNDTAKSGKTQHDIKITIPGQSETKLKYQ